MKAAATQRGGQALRYLFLRSNFLEARIAADAPALVAFAAEPQIVAFSGRILPGIADRPRLAEGFDILANILTVYDDPLAKPGTSAGAALFQFQQGIVDTVLEYVLMGDSNALSAFSVTAAALRRDGSAALVSIRPGDQAAVERLDVDPAVRASIRQDLQQGYVVIAPASAVDLGQRKSFAWWRVHPDTGETLGVGPGGRGQSFVEKVLIEATLFTGHFLECYVIEVAVMAWKDNYDDAMGRAVVCLAFTVVMMFAGDMIWRALGRVLDRLKAVASKSFAKAATWAGNKFKKPVYTPGTPPVPNPGKSVGKGVGDAVKGAGPARPGPVVDPKAPTISEPGGAMTPTRPAGPHGTEIFPPIQ
jgi:hypothetical protein